MGSSRPYREPFCSGLTFGAPHPGHLRVSVDNLRQITGITGNQLVLGQFSPRSPSRDDVGHDTAVVGGDMRQPSTPRGISQRVEPTACDADRLEMVVHRNDPSAGQANGCQSEVVGIGAPSGGQDDLVYLDALALEGCGDGPARDGAG